MTYMLEGYSSLPSISDISKWNIKDIDNMNDFWTGCLI
jgi:hypothetical protein